MIKKLKKLPLSILIIFVSVLSLVLVQQQVFAGWEPPEGPPPIGEAHLFVNPMVEDLNLNNFTLIEDRDGFPATDFVIDPDGPTGLRIGGTNWAGYFNGNLNITDDLCFDGADCIDEWGDISDTFWQAGSGNEIYYDQTGGNVGIGTNNPGYLLHVDGIIKAEDGLRSDGMLEFDLPGSGDFIALRGTGTTDNHTLRFDNKPLRFWTSGEGTVIHISTSTDGAYRGLVGINKEPAFHPLDVNGAIYTQAHLLSNAWYGTDGNDDVTLEDIWLGDEGSDLQVQGRICFGIDNSDCADTWLGAGGDGYIGENQDHIAGGDLTFPGHSITFQRPSTGGGWARGLKFQNLAGDNTHIALGYYGNGDIFQYGYIGVGDNPWQDTHMRFYDDLDSTFQGNVGIGIDDPQVLLDLNNSAGEKIKLDNFILEQVETVTEDYGFNLNSGPAVNKLILRNLSGPNNTQAFLFGDGGGVENIFGVSSNEDYDGVGIWEPKFVIGNNGRVGIGNNNPDYALDIYDDDSIAAINIKNAGDYLWTGTRLSRDNWEAWFTGINDSDNTFRFRYGGNTDVVTIDPNGNTLMNGYLGFYGTDNRLRITPDTTYNSTNGHFIHTAVSGDGVHLPIVFRTSSANRMIVGTNGDIGIGTMAPAYDLDVNGQANADQLCIAGDCRAVWPGGGSADGYIGDNSPDPHVVGADLNLNGHWIAGDGDNEGLFVDTAGRVGIGDNTPSGNLDINSRFIVDTAFGSPDRWKLAVGDGSGWKGHIAQNDGDILVTFRDDGNVGIGDATPDYPLDVANNSINVEGSSNDVMYRVMGRESMGYYPGWDSDMLYINPWDHWLSGVTIAGEGGLYVDETIYSDKDLAPGSGDIPSLSDSKILFYGSGNNWSGMGVDTGGNFWLRTGTAIDHVLTFKEFGYLGIGMTDPNYELDVNGDANADRLCINGDCRNVWPGGGSDGYIGDAGTHNAGGQLNMLTHDITLGNNSTVDGYDLSDYGPYWVNSAGTDDYVWTSDGNGRGGWEPAAGGGLWLLGQNDKIYYDTANVGIGVGNNPAYKLDVGGDIFTNTHLLSDAWYGTSGNGGASQNLWIGDSNDEVQIQGTAVFGGGPSIYRDNNKLIIDISN